MAEKKTSFFERPLAFTDLETTGIVPGYHEIIEIGLVLVDQRTEEPMLEFSSKVKPEHPERITEMAQKINGYNAADWENAPNLRTVLQQYADLTADAILIAHNVTFEWMFLQPAFQDTGVENRLDYHRLCNASCAWQVLRRKGLTKFSQDTVAEFLGLPPEPPTHRAVNGAWLAYEIYRKLGAL